MRPQQDRGDPTKLAIPSGSAHRRICSPLRTFSRTFIQQVMKKPTPVELGYHMPAEWRRHHATWLTWPKDPLTWPDRVPLVEDIFLQMMAALTPHETVNLLVDNAD